ncbi:polysaccharide deacetylase [Phlyctema vagabunda]|uniref:Polysaccharide deacetylase n=1 Tax=Phlyctema vagabunda TaxID=108571 RepID=A0ABR4PHF7_9HELO
MFSKLVLLSLGIVGSVFADSSEEFSKLVVGRGAGTNPSSLKSRNLFAKSAFLETRKNLDSSQRKRQTAVVPAGLSTADIPRPHIGSVPYGVTITSCTAPGVVALTFDDGPSRYTRDLLDLLDSFNAKSTFFVTGLNGEPQGIDDCATEDPALIQRIYNSGHQLAHHTWNHPSLNGLSDTDFNNEMYWNEMALRNILGVIPTYMRPPYLECDDACLSRMAGLGYHVVSTDLDTQDWQYQTPETAQTSKDIYSAGINARPSSAIVLAHDIHFQTVYNLTRHMLETTVAAGYTFATVGTCLGDAPENWYRAAGSAVVCNTTTAPPAEPVVSTDGACGVRITCQGSIYGNCCSQWGWCGSTNDHCLSGCQTGFGTCGAV